MLLPFCICPRSSVLDPLRFAATAYISVAPSVAGQAVRRVSRSRVLGSPFCETASLRADARIAGCETTALQRTDWPAVDLNQEAKSPSGPVLAGRFSPSSSSRFLCGRRHQQFKMFTLARSAVSECTSAVRPSESTAPSSSPFNPSVPSDPLLSCSSSPWDDTPPELSFSKPLCTSHRKQVRDCSAETAGHCMGVTRTGVLRRAGDADSDPAPALSVSKATSVPPSTSGRPRYGRPCQARPSSCQSLSFGTVSPSASVSCGPVARMPSLSGVPSSCSPASSPCSGCSDCMYTMAAQVHVQLGSVRVKFLRQQLIDSLRLYSRLSVEQQLLGAFSLPPGFSARPSATCNRIQGPDSQPRLASGSQSCPLSPSAESAIAGDALSSAHRVPPRPAHLPPPLRPSRKPQGNAEETPCISSFAPVDPTLLRQPPKSTFSFTMSSPFSFLGQWKFLSRFRAQPRSTRDAGLSVECSADAGPPHARGSFAGSSPDKGVSRLSRSEERTARKDLALFSCASVILGVGAKDLRIRLHWDAEQAEEIGNSEHLLLKEGLEEKEPERRMTGLRRPFRAKRTSGDSCPSSEGPFCSLCLQRGRTSSRERRFSQFRSRGIRIRLQWLSCLHRATACGCPCPFSACQQGADCDLIAEARRRSTHASLLVGFCRPGREEALPAAATRTASPCRPTCSKSAPWCPVQTKGKNSNSVSMVTRAPTESSGQAASAPPSTEEHGDNPPLQALRPSDIRAETSALQEDGETATQRGGEKESLWLHGALFSLDYAEAFDTTCGVCLICEAPPSVADKEAEVGGERRSSGANCVPCQSGGDLHTRQRAGPVYRVHSDCETDSRHGNRRRRLNPGKGWCQAARESPTLSTHGRQEQAANGYKARQAPSSVACSGADDPALPVTQLGEITGATERAWLSDEAPSDIPVLKERLRRTRQKRSVRSPLLSGCGEATLDARVRGLSVPLDVCSRPSRQAEDGRQSAPGLSSQGQTEDGDRPAFHGAAASLKPGRVSQQVGLAEPVCQHGRLSSYSDLSSSSSSSLPCSSRPALLSSVTSSRHRLSSSDSALRPVRGRVERSCWLVSPNGPERFATSFEPSEKVGCVRRSPETPSLDRGIFEGAGRASPGSAGTGALKGQKAVTDTHARWGPSACLCSLCSSPKEAHAACASRLFARSQAVRSVVDCFRLCRQLPRLSSFTQSLERAAKSGLAIHQVIDRPAGPTGTCFFNPNRTKQRDSLRTKAGSPQSCQPRQIVAGGQAEANKHCCLPRTQGDKGDERVVLLRDAGQLLCWPGAAVDFAVGGVSLLLLSEDQGQRPSGSRSSTACTEEKDHSDADNADSGGTDSTSSAAVSAAESVDTRKESEGGGALANEQATARPTGRSPGNSELPASDPLVGMRLGTAATELSRVHDAHARSGQESGGRSQARRKSIPSSDRMDPRRKGRRRRLARALRDRERYLATPPCQGDLGGAGLHVCVEKLELRTTGVSPAAGWRCTSRGGSLDSPTRCCRDSERAQESSSDSPSSSLASRCCDCPCGPPSPSGDELSFSGEEDRGKRRGAAEETQRADTALLPGLSAHRKKSDARADPPHGVAADMVRRVRPKQWPAVDSFGSDEWAPTRSSGMGDPSHGDCGHLTVGKDEGEVAARLPLRFSAPSMSRSGRLTVGSRSEAAGRDSGRHVFCWRDSTISNIHSSSQVLPSRGASSPDVRNTSDQREEERERAAGQRKTEHRTRQGGGERTRREVNTKGSDGPGEFAGRKEQPPRLVDDFLRANSRGSCHGTVCQGPSDVHWNAPSVCGLGGEGARTAKSQKDRTRTDGSPRADVFSLPPRGWYCFSPCSRLHVCLYNFSVMAGREVPSPGHDAGAGADPRDRRRRKSMASRSGEADCLSDGPGGGREGGATVRREAAKDKPVFSRCILDSQTEDPRNAEGPRFTRHASYASPPEARFFLWSDFVAPVSLQTVVHVSNHRGSSCTSPQPRSTASRSPEAHGPVQEGDHEAQEHTAESRFWNEGRLALLGRTGCGGNTPEGNGIDAFSQPFSHADPCPQGTKEDSCARETVRKTEDKESVVPLVHVEAWLGSIALLANLDVLRVLSAFTRCRGAAQQRREVDGEAATSLPPASTSADSDPQAAIPVWSEPGGQTPCPEHGFAPSLGSVPLPRRLYGSGRQGSESLENRPDKVRGSAYQSEVGFEALSDEAPETSSVYFPPSRCLLEEDPHMTLCGCSFRCDSCGSLQHLPRLKNDSSWGAVTEPAPLRQAESKDRRRHVCSWDAACAVTPYEGRGGSRRSPAGAGQDKRAVCWRFALSTVVRLEQIYVRYEYDRKDSRRRHVSGSAATDSERSEGRGETKLVGPANGRRFPSGPRQPSAVDVSPVEAASILGDLDLIHYVLDARGLVLAALLSPVSAAPERAKSRSFSGGAALSSGRPRGAKSVIGEPAEEAPEDPKPRSRVLGRSASCSSPVGRSAQSFSSLKPSSTFSPRSRERGPTDLTEDPDASPGSPSLSAYQSSPIQKACFSLVGGEAHIGDLKLMEYGASSFDMQINAGERKPACLCPHPLSPYPNETGVMEEELQQRRKLRSAHKAGKPQRSRFSPPPQLGVFRPACCVPWRSFAVPRECRTHGLTQTTQQRGMERTGGRRAGQMPWLDDGCSSWARSLSHSAWRRWGIEGYGEFVSASS